MKVHPVLWGRLVSGGFIALLVIQLAPYGRNHVNPPTTSEPTWDSLATRTLAKQACFDWKPSGPRTRTSLLHPGSFSTTSTRAVQH
jgi:hypothetical protein